MMQFRDLFHSLTRDIEWFSMSDVSLRVNARPDFQSVCGHDLKRASLLYFFISS